MKNQNLYFSAKNIFPCKLNSEKCKKTINSYHNKPNDYFVNINSNNNCNYSTINYNKLYNPIKDIYNQSSYLENYFNRKNSNSKYKIGYSKNISDASIETKQTEKVSVKRSLISNNNSLLNSISQKEENLKIPSLKKRNQSQKKINLKKFLYQPNKININNKIVNSINISFDKDMNCLDIDKLNLTNYNKLNINNEKNSKKLLPVNDLMNYLFNNTNYILNNKTNTNNIKKVNNCIDSNNSEKNNDTNKNNEFENENIINDNDNIIIDNNNNENKIEKSYMKIIHNYSYEYNHVYNNIIEKYNNYFYDSNYFKINNYYDMIKIQTNIKYVKTYYFFISKQEEIYIPGKKKNINIPKLKISEIKNINFNKENLMSSSNRLNIKENGYIKNNNITSYSNITSSIESIYLISDSQNKINPIKNFIPNLNNNLLLNKNDKNNFNNKVTKRSSTLYYNNNNSNEKELDINNIVPLKTGESIDGKNILENQTKNLAIQIPEKIISESFVNDDDFNNLLTSSSFRNVINDLKQNIKNQIKLIEDKNKINKNNIILHLSNQNIFYLKLLKEKNKIKSENTIFYNHEILIQNFNIIIKMLNNFDHLKNKDSNLFNYDTILEILNENLAIIKDINKFVIINDESKDK